MVPLKVGDVLQNDFYWNSVIKKSGYGQTNRPTNRPADQLFLDFFDS